MAVIEATATRVEMAVQPPRNGTIRAWPFYVLGETFEGVESRERKSSAWEMEPSGLIAAVGFDKIGYIVLR